MMMFKNGWHEVMAHICPDGFVPLKVAIEVGHTRISLVPPMGGLERSLLHKYPNAGC